MALPQIPWRPLGRLLVERGLLTDEDLDKALAEQKRSGRKLGEIVVERGLISWPTLTSLLAAQYGLELQTEDGFGSGLRIEIERRHDDRRTGRDRRQERDRRQGDRRQGDRRQGGRDEGAEATVRPHTADEDMQPVEVPDEYSSPNGHDELEILRATHHAWLAELTEKFREQHAYLNAAAAKIDEHERTLAEVRLANESLEEEVDRLRMQLEESRPSAPEARAKPAAARAKTQPKRRPRSA